MRAKNQQVFAQDFHCRRIVDRLNCIRYIALRKDWVPFETVHHGALEVHDHCLLPAEVVFKTFYVIFAKVIACLYFDEDHIAGTRVEDAVFRLLGNLDRIAWI